jgi:hypothetical protein
VFIYLNFFCKSTWIYLKLPTCAIIGGCDIPPHHPGRNGPANYLQSKFTIIHLYKSIKCRRYTLGRPRKVGIPLYISCEMNKSKLWSSLLYCSRARQRVTCVMFVFISQDIYKGIRTFLGRPRVIRGVTLAGCCELRSELRCEVQKFILKFTSPYVNKSSDWSLNKS